MYYNMFFGFLLSIFCIAACSFIDVLHVLINLLFRDAGVIHMNYGLIIHQVIGYIHGGCFSRIVGVFFEGPSQEGDFFPGNGIV